MGINPIGNTDIVSGDLRIGPASAILPASDHPIAL